MLRRPPTAIALTTEDVIVYEDNRAREALLEEQAALEAAQATAQAKARQSTPQKNQNLRDPNDELRPLPPDRTRAPQKSREERLGLGGGTSSRG
jgi:Anaphase-promoting complex APC subunit CDC26